MTGVSVQRLVEKSEGIDAGDIVGQVGDVVSSMIGVARADGRLYLMMLHFRHSCRS